MSREIKFRAWEKREKRMIYAEEAKNDKSLLAVGFHGLPIAVNSGSFKDDEIIGWNIDHRLELMQYTGLKDRKGQEIYEGDIVRIEEGVFGVIRYGRACFYLDDEEDGRTALEDVGSHLIEVVSNIYEHPEILPKSLWEEVHA